MVKSLMDQMKQDDGVTDQNVNQSRTTEDDSERDVYQVRIQEKAETIWSFDTGADAHVMPKHVWEQLREPSLQTTKVTLRGATGQDLGAMGEVQVKGFIGKTKGPVHISGCTRRETTLSEWNVPWNKGIHVHFESAREFSHTTKPQRKGDDVTRRQQRHFPSCMHVEAKRCMVGNVSDIEPRVGKCET